MKKIHILGASFSGKACALKLAQLMPELEIILIDKEVDAQYIPNGVNDQLRGKIIDLAESKMELWNDEEICQRLIVTHAEVLEIRSKEQVLLLRYPNNELKIEPYETLICAMGSIAKSQYIKGSDLDGVLTTKTFKESQKALEMIKEKEDIIIVGAGIIGIDLAYSLSLQGKKVTLLEATDTIQFRQFDKEMMIPLQAEMEAIGIRIVKNVRVKEISQTNSGNLRLISDSGQSYEGERVLLAVNFRPNSHLLESVVERSLDKTVKVNKNLRTSDPHIYAIGDLIALPLSTIHLPYYSPLINQAIKTGQYLAYHLAGIDLPPLQQTKVIGSHSFNLYQSSVGLTEEEGSLYEDLVSHCQKIQSDDNSSALAWLKLIARRKDGRIVGCQIISKDNHLLLINQVSQAISIQLSDSELAFQDFVFLKGESEMAFLLHEAALGLFEKRLLL